MKLPLRYQVTEYDCGTTSIINAITYLFDRELIPPTLIYNIMKYTLDEFNDMGEESKGGTSTHAVKFLAHWINSFAKTKNFNIYCNILDKDNASLENDEVKTCLKNKGVIVARVWHAEVEHYVIITSIDKEFAYIFCPYYMDITAYDNDEQVEIVKFRKLEYNRKASLARVMSNTNKDYSIVNNENREILLINKYEK